jgi:hypothetical protein
MDFYGGDFYNGDYSTFLMRIIPDEATLPPSSDFYPEIAPWLPALRDELMYGSERLATMIQLSQEQTENPLISWKRMAPMLESIEPENIRDLALEELAPDSYISQENGEIDWPHFNFFEMSRDKFNSPNRSGRIHLGGFSRPTGPDLTAESQYISSIRNEPALFCFSVEKYIYISILIEPLNYGYPRSGFPKIQLNNLSLYLWLVPDL